MPSSYHHLTIGELIKQFKLEHNSWTGMRERCRCETSASYKNYGGRGITVCDRWYHSFANFLEDMGPKPSPKLTIDRIDNDGNYDLATVVGQHGRNSADTNADL